ncbi:Indoleamine 2,3-dioxygenase [Lentinula boryana]|uniref:Indoleamine 2,3-dioxygenase n=1 Tax=Lentinula boryana TaxID=40481 RepID=A0ABQ8Q0G4_9AGAR|nr:Indoleamine 2,3-dioxygenase [Lentinula boryana]
MQSELGSSITGIDTDTNMNFIPNPPSTLSSTHFLSLPRPSSSSLSWSPSPATTPTPIVDTTTLAAHDFDVDPRTGFMPPHPPLTHLPPSLEGVPYAEWEGTLKEACETGLEVVDKKGGVGREVERRSEVWREGVRKLPILSITPLLKSEIMLRRGHHVLAWILHFYIHTYPLTDPSILIPPPLTLPLLEISRELHLPPVLTYSDDVLYNWGLVDPTRGLDMRNLRVLTSFTGTPSESHFYLTSARIELIGVRALALMQSTMDELFVGDEIAVKRITGYLRELRGVVGEMVGELKGMREGCDPGVFFERIRPWFRGFDSTLDQRPWIFQGLDSQSHPSPTELSGPSAGQSTLIHALDIFLGIHHGPSAHSILMKMRAYMPRHHRMFLSHLSEGEGRRSVRGLVEGVGEGEDKNKGEEDGNGNGEGDKGELVGAYNEAVGALRKLRETHFGVVRRYIMGPAAAAATAAATEAAEAAAMEANTNTDMATVANTDMGGNEQRLKGTGGTDLARFLKEVRDNTREAVMGGR